MVYRRKFRNSAGSMLIAAMVIGSLIFIGRDGLRAEIRDIMDPPRVYGAVPRNQQLRIFAPRPDGNYRNCAQAFAAGRMSIPRHDPSYRARLDGDSDGLACEPH